MCSSRDGTAGERPAPGPAGTRAEGGPRGRRPRRRHEPDHRHPVRPAAGRRGTRPAAGRPAAERPGTATGHPVAQGATNAQIAGQLHISVRIVGSHLDRIRDKTGCRRRADLARLALASRPGIAIIPVGHADIFRLRVSGQDLFRRGPRSWAPRRPASRRTRRRWRPPKGTPGGRRRSGLLTTQPPEQRAAGEYSAGGAYPSAKTRERRRGSGVARSGGAVNPDHHRLLPPRPGLGPERASVTTARPGRRRR